MNANHPFVRAVRIAFVLGMASVGAVAQSLPSVKEVTDRLQQRYDMIDDVSATFTQTVALGYANIRQSFEGTIRFKKPRQYRMETDQQTLITDGKTVWAYVPANDQVIVDVYKEQRNSVSPEEFLLTLPTTYYTTVLGRETSGGKQMLQLKLTPRDDRSFVKNVRLWIVEANMEIRKIQIVDQNDTETTYAIDSIQLNSNLEDSQFRFSPPEGTEIVDLR